LVAELSEARSKNFVLLDHKRLAVVGSFVSEITASQKGLSNFSSWRLSSLMD
jgi:hypothetical protein